MNKIFLHGRLGADPKSGTHPDGSKWCHFSLATSTKSSDGKEFTQWHSIFTRDSQADSCAKYLKKGSSCLIEGSISYKKVDEKHTEASIKATRVYFTGGTKSEADMSIPGRDEAMSVVKNSEGIDALTKLQADLFGTDDIPF